MVKIVIPSKARNLHLDGATEAHPMCDAVCPLVKDFVDP
jgi:hypothetical protein